MEINIDVSKIVAETLKNYPSCAHLKGEFEAIYQEHYEKLKDSVAASKRLGGLDKMIESYEVPFNRNRDYYLENDFAGFAHNSGKTLDEVKAEREIELQYFKQVVDELKALQEFQQRSAMPIRVKQKKDSLTFEQLFVPNAMERALAAAIAEGLIEKGGKGYTWIYTGAKSHGVCAFWFAAKEAGLTKKNLKNNERITGAIRAFFQMDSLAKGTLDNANESASEFVNLKRKLKNKIPDLQ